MKIGIVTRDWSNWVEPGQERQMGGSGHYRCALPAKVLREMGYEVVVGTLTAHNRLPELGVRTWAEENHFGCDIILMQRWMFADLPEKMHRARANGQVVLNDVDDWWEKLDPGNLAHWQTDPRVSPLENRDHYREVLRASTAIVCSTPFLAERYKALAPTVMIRNALDLARWKPEPHDGPLTIGWVGATPWRSDGDLKTLKGWLGPFAERHDLRIRHAGAYSPGWELAIATGFAPHRLDQTPMVPVDEHERQFRGMDIALVPLAMIEFNRAKSALKGMQAAAAGVPFVATPTDEYRWLREERGIGALAKNSQAWQNALERLMDPQERARAAMENHARVQGMGLKVLRENWRALLSALPVRRAA